MSELELQTTNNDLSPIDRPWSWRITTYEARRMGNTTRIIDSIIQLLFTTNTIILIRDHCQNGTHDKANKDLFKRILKRLQSEHNITFSKVEGAKELYSSNWTNIIVNSSSLTIQRIE